MIKYLNSPVKNLLFILLLTLIALSCSKENVEETQNTDSIAGSWFLTKVNTIDVSDVECYEDSFIESNGETITFFILDRTENGECETVLSNTQDLTIEGGFFFLGDEAIKFILKTTPLRGA